MTIKNALSWSNLGQGAATDSGFSPHANALELAQFGEPVHADDTGKNKADHGDTAKSKVGLLDKVFQVHTVERRKECPCSESECSNAEFQVKKHERISVGVEDCFHAAWNQVSMVVKWNKRALSSTHTSSVFLMLVTRLPLDWTISSQTLWYDSRSISTS